MMKKSIPFKKSALAVVVSGAMLSAASQSWATFLNDDITVTFDVGGFTDSETVTATGPQSGTGGLSPSGAPADSASANVEMFPDDDEFFYNIGIFNSQQAVDVVLTISDIEWLDMPGEIVGLTDINQSNGMVNFDTGPDSVTVSFSMGVNETYEASGVFTLVAEHSGVPEPGTLALLGLGLSSLAGPVARRRKRRSTPS